MVCLFVCLFSFSRFLADFMSTGYLGRLSKTTLSGGELASRMRTAGSCDVCVSRGLKLMHRRFSHVDEDPKGPNLKLIVRQRSHTTKTALSKLIRSLQDVCLSSSSKVNTLTSPCLFICLSSSGKVNTLTSPCLFICLSSSGKVNTLTFPCLFVCRVASR